uniref:Squalene monooxygenase n=1 Tax=Cyprinus carpio carpio TaxID=630221 RepID=A0A9J7WW66_CYPCA
NIISKSGRVILNVKQICLFLRWNGYIIHDTESGLVVTQCGQAFHHRRFIMGLRRAALTEPNVRFTEGTVTYLEEENGCYTGIQYKDKHSGKIQRLQAPLIVVADRCFSKFRQSLGSDQASTSRVLLLGDTYSMRHPLTGGILDEAFFNWLLTGLFDRCSLNRIIKAINTCRLFSILDLRRACLCYFQLGGECVSGAVGLLSMRNPRPMTLIGHFSGVRLRSMAILNRAFAVIFPLIFFEFKYLFYGFFVGL